MITAPARVAQTVTGVAAGLALLWAFRAVIQPFVIALVLLVLVDATARVLMRAMPRAPSWLVVIGTGAILGLAVLGSAFVVVRGAAQLMGQAGRLEDRLDDLLALFGAQFGVTEPLHLRGLLSRIDLPSLIQNVLGQLQGAMAGITLTLLFLAFLLATRHRIDEKIDRIAASSALSTQAHAVVERCVKGVEAYVWVQTVTGAMIAGASGLVMLAMGLENALFWTLMLFLLSYIPVLGVAIGSIAPALFALLQFPNAWPAVVIFGAIQAVSFVVGNLVLPKMQADTQNIDPSAGLVALGAWTLIWGISGAFLAIPLTLALMFLFAQFDSTRWVAILISNDGRPLPAVEPPEDV
ncbi:MAG: AI-2E family transporter [Phenylobacterium sp.]